MAEGQEQSFIEADANPVYSDYASDSIESETQSLTSSVHEFFEQNGRRYHTYFGPDKCLMPNDEKEQSRLDALHELQLVLTRRLTQAPVQNNLEIQRVLDLGTGTGVWAVDFAYENEHAQVYGIDLSPIQPQWVPPNCRFELDDFELDWNFKQPFDFIHARMISQSVSDWNRLLRRAKDHLNAGGWIEITEANFTPKSDDNTIPPDWPPLVLWNLITKGLKQSGRSPVDSSEAFEKLVKDVGFTEVQAKRFKIPSGVWPKSDRMKQAGRFALVCADTGYEAYALAVLTRVLGMPEEEVLELCKKAKEAHMDRKVHAYWDLYMVFGRKAVDDGEANVSGGSY